MNPLFSYLRAIVASARYGHANDVLWAAYWAIVACRDQDRP